MLALAMKLTLLIVVGLVLLAAVLWDAGERHYSGCVNAAKARVATGSATQREYERFTGEAATTRAKAVAGCSRVPW
jgi:hypothetical protein